MGRSSRSRPCRRRSDRNCTPRISMALYKRGEVWWYKFVWKGEPIRVSTKQGNKRVAEQIEAAKKTQLAKGEVGIEERPQAPTLKAFAVEFARAIETDCAQKPRTIEFYKSRLRQLLESSLAGKRLDRIDEAAIERYREDRVATMSRFGRLLSPASVNRELA